MPTFNESFPAEPNYEPRHLVVDCAGALLSAHVTRIATVLSVDGEVDASNADLLAQAIRGFAQLQAPLILDLRHLDFLGLAGLRVLVTLNREHQQALVHCSVIAGAAVRRLTRIFTDHGLPLVDSIPEAVQLIDAVIQSRRQFVADLVRELRIRRRRFSVRSAGAQFCAPPD